MTPEPTTQTATSTVDRTGDKVCLRLAGDWRLRPGLPGREALECAISPSLADATVTVRLDTAGVTAWDAGLLVFAVRCQELCERLGARFDPQGLPEGAQRLLRLSRAVPEQKDARRSGLRPPWLRRVGEGALVRYAGAREVFAFLGDCALSLTRLVRGRAQFQWSEAWLVMESCGSQALGIVALINFLVGMILAFVGAVQLTQFGAAVYVADLVAIGAVRELACIMTGIILCGRTGAAFAAQLGTMTVNEEIDALRTFGVSPMDFLVLPRLLALLVTMPFLCAFADLIAVFGGFTVSVLLLDLTATEYWLRTIEAISLTGFLLGIAKGACFGGLIALTGCLRGMQCGATAAAVGQATTSAVVSGITAIIAADGLFAVLCNALGI